MGLTVSMCNDVEKYEESVFGGFSVKKLFFLLLAALVGAAVMAFFTFVLHVHIMVSVFLMMPVVVPIIMRGFYGGGSVSLVHGILAALRKKKPLTYQSTEARRGVAMPEKKDGKHGEKRTKKQKSGRR